MEKVTGIASTGWIKIKAYFKIKALQHDQPDGQFALTAVQNMDDRG
jgi:hypothetical protein